MTDRSHDYKLRLEKNVYGMRYDAGAIQFDPVTMRIVPVAEPRPLTRTEEDEVLASVFAWLHRS